VLTKGERPMRAAIAGALTAALITLPGLGIGTLWDNSETTYGEVAREILITHNWAIMHFDGFPYFVQPPLYFWIAALFATFLGPTALALRLPSALATIVLGGLTGYAVARQAGTRVGVFAAVILSTCLMQVVIGRLAIMDALLDLTVAMTIFWWFRGLQTGRDRYFIGGCAAAGFGFLDKGLVAPVIALLVIVPYFLWNRRHEPTHAPSLRAWLGGAAAFLAVTLPWLAVAAQHHFAQIERAVMRYTIGRYTGVIENQSGPVWYYVPVVLLGFFPWSAFLPMAWVYGARQLRDRVTDPRLARLLRLSLVWIVMPLLFFSFARTKLPNYVALEFPALALVTALYFEVVVRKGGTRSAWISASFVPITIGSVAFAAAAFVHSNRLSVELSGVLPGLIGLGAAVFAGSALTAVLVARRASVGAAPYALAAAMLIAIDLLAIAALAQAETYKPVPRLAAIIQRERRPYDGVAIQSMSGASALLFYTRPYVETLAPATGGDPATNGVDPRILICGLQRLWLVAPRRRPAYDPTFGRRRRVVDTDRNAALFLYDGPPCSATR
jgi:4-amino-4-deoxy-L-arabinose transferase-like glycosyltransferase